jgi:hypothetical protein
MRTSPKPFRAACAGKAAEFTHAKPAHVFDRVPLLREMTDWQLDDWERRLAEDITRDPDYYDLPRPRPPLVPGTRPDQDYHKAVGRPAGRGCQTPRGAARRELGAFLKANVAPGPIS